MSLPKFTRKELYLSYLNGDTSVELPAPVTNEEHYLYELCMNKSQGGTGGVSSWNDLTDKPFDRVIEYVDIFLRETFAATDEGVIKLPKFTLFGGESYSVRWNGTLYTCIAQDLTEMLGMKIVALGNVGAALGGDMTEEPFVIIYDESDGGFCQAMSLDGSTNVTITLTGKTYVYHKLDERYLDNNTVYIELTPRNDDYTEFNMKNSAYSALDIYRMIMIENKNVILRFQANGVATFYHPSRIGMDSLFFGTIMYGSNVTITELQYLESNGYWIVSHKIIGN